MKKRNKGRNIVLIAIILGIISWLTISGILTIITIANNYLVQIICTAIVISFLFGLYLSGMYSEFLNDSRIKEKRLNAIFIAIMIIELIFMIGLILYSGFTTPIIQESILKVLGIGGFTALMVLTLIADLVIKYKK